MNQIQGKLINIVKCSYCDTDMIDSELVCQECIPKLNIDIAISDVNIAIKTLKQNKYYLTEERKKNINSLFKEFSSIIDNI